MSRRWILVAALVVGAAMAAWAGCKMLWQWLLSLHAGGAHTPSGH